MGLFDAFRSQVANFIAPAPSKPALFVPAFKKIYVYPPYDANGRLLNDGSFFHTRPLREYATRETAEWVKNEFHGEAVVGRPDVASGAFHIHDHKVEVGPLAPFHAVSLPVVQWFVRFSPGVEIPAGHLAWYFSKRAPDAVEGDADAGFWNHDASDDVVMTHGKARAQWFLNDSLRWA